MAVTETGAVTARGTRMAQAELVALAEGPLCDAVYQRLLMPAFPPDELLTLAAIRDGLRTGLLEGLVAVDGDGRPLGVSVGEWSPAARVMLLSYLAVAAETRGTGIGSLLYTTQLDRWRETLRPCLVLAEVERPDAHTGDAHRGDPQARLRFYARHGARALDVPYFQPAFGPGRERVYGMLLLALHVDPELAGSGADTVAAEPVRQFLTQYLSSAEGSVGDDPATEALRRAVGDPAAVRLLPVDRYGDIARSRH